MVLIKRIGNSHFKQRLPQKLNLPSNLTFENKLHSEIINSLLVDNPLRSMLDSLSVDLTQNKET